MVADKTGSLSGIKRHDYLPFGEELFAGSGGRTTAQGYLADGVRQKFTQKERDVETGLDYFLARYYSSVQGRFTSPDEFTGGPDELYAFVDDAADNPTFYADPANPQTLNKYQYAYNNPLRYVDADGHDPDGQEPLNVEPKTPASEGKGSNDPQTGTFTHPYGPQLGGAEDKRTQEWIDEQNRIIDNKTKLIPAKPVSIPPLRVLEPVAPKAPPSPTGAGHKTNRSPSNKPKHQRGTERRGRDKGGETADPQRQGMPWHQKRPKKWKGPWPPPPKPE
jgi:RHS repeat-associated protein